MTFRQLARCAYRCALSASFLGPIAASAQVAGGDSLSRARADSILAVGESLARASAPEEWARAIEIWREAVPLFERSGVREGAAFTLGRIADVYSLLSRFDSAAAYHTSALSIWRELGEALGEARTLSNIGKAHAALGRPDSALFYYARALLRHRDAEDPAGEAAALINTGWMHQRLGRSDSAMIYHARALPLMRATGDTAGEAAALNNIGGAHHTAGRSDSALVYFAEALRIRREIGDRTGEAATLNNLGRVYDELGELDLALAYHLAALPLRRQVGDRAGEATTLGNIGLIHSYKGDLDSALVYFSRAALIQREHNDRWGEATSFHNLGQAHLMRPLEQGSAALAAAAFDTAAALLARTRRSAGGDANAVSFSETINDTFTGWSRAWSGIAALSRAAGDTQGARRAVVASLAAAERGRAQALRDLIDRGRSDPSAIDATDTIPGTDLAAEGDRLLAPLRATRTTLLFYLVVDDALVTWFQRPDGDLDFLPAIPLSKVDLASLVAISREHLGADQAAMRQRRGEAQRSAADLGADLLPADPARAEAALLTLSSAVLPPGLEQILPPGVELVIVPHGALGQIPFAALTLPGDAVPLGVRNPLRYAPSLRALIATSGAAAPAVSHAPLVVGNPEMPYLPDERNQLRQLSQLSGAAAEGRWVADRLGTRALTGAAASEAVVRDAMTGASIIHLATHGLAYGTEDRVRDSYVALAPGLGEDGFLTVGELLDEVGFHLAADLVVLSACQTGLGEARDAEGTVGLQRALLAKGARSVLVSLWSVDDAATLLLMQRFYTHWLDDTRKPVMSKSKALQLAQADVRSDERFRNPRYWAAFQLVGMR